MTFAGESAELNTVAYKHLSLIVLYARPKYIRTEVHTNPNKTSKKTDRERRNLPAKHRSITEIDPQQNTNSGRPRPKKQSSIMLPTS